MCWGGIRGGLSMVLALALPSAFPHRQFLVDVVFGVVVISILVQGSTMAPLLKRLGIVSDNVTTKRYEIARVGVLAARAGLDELTKIEQGQTRDPALFAELRANYTARIAEADGRMRALDLPDRTLEIEEQRRIHRRLILVEKERIQATVREGLATEEAADEVLASLEARLLQIDDPDTA